MSTECGLTGARCSQRTWSGIRVSNTKTSSFCVCARGRRATFGGCLDHGLADRIGHTMDRNDSSMFGSLCGRRRSAQREHRQRNDITKPGGADPRNKLYPTQAAVSDLLVFARVPRAAYGKRQFSSPPQSTAGPHFNDVRPSAVRAGVSERRLGANWVGVVDIPQPWSDPRKKGPELGGRSVAAVLPPQVASEVAEIIGT